ncbi:N-formylglutamate amidohydrolase [Labrenzia sp. THAF191b]|nr:N-formylglutamate amidohydrolase [Pseudomonadota bacterium]QFS98141.1 N-formylglutamate amidohydrolase [Labrenzia sp. THAF191b]QFT04455.1 N-formylglutamate amidohydrolase [Labrenzia sp. THAF191a]QFT15999.1 N-formylglutamate amidohydrolase [Labrenzia sp. THAF187b]
MGSNPQTGGMTRAVAVENAEGAGPFVFVCDHASNFFPPPYDTSLGITDADKIAHIAWDPGALGVARGLAKSLDAPLVHTTVSRLIIDCNREESRADLIPCLSETTQIAGNRNLSADEKAFRLNLAHRPFHKAIDKVINQRLDRGLPTAVVSIHSFTPVYKGQSRPWEIGLIYDKDRRLADPVLEGLKAKGGLTVGDNEPYAPSDGVYYTIRRHGEDRKLPCLMIEIRNDEVKTSAEEAQWSDLLAPLLEHAAQAVGGQTQGEAHA